MTIVAPSDNIISYLTQETAVDLMNPPPKTKDFGILDIRAESIKTPPQFTEEATIMAMKNLGISADDLVLLSSRTDAGTTFSDDSEMKLQIMNELEKKRFEAIEKVIEERNRILMMADTKVPIPKTIDENNDELDQNIIAATGKSQSSRKKKKGLKSGRKKTKKKSSIDEEADELDSGNDNTSSRNKRKRKKKTTKSSSHKFRSRKAQASLPNSHRQNSKPSTNRRPSVAERRKKYATNRLHPKNPNMDQNDPGEHFQLNGRKNIINTENNIKNDIMLVNIRVKANEERCRLEREEKQQLIKQKAQLRMQQLKGEESQFEKIKKDKKSKAEEEMKRKERLYMRLQEKKMKAFEQDKKKRQQKIYNSKIKQEDNNENEGRFSKLRQKLLEAQGNNNNNNSNDCVNNNNNTDIDLFLVTQPKNPKLPNVSTNNVDSLPSNRESSNENDIKATNTSKATNSKNRANSEISNEKNIISKQPIITNCPPKPLLSSTLNPPAVKKIKPQPYPKARSSLQNKNSSYYKQLLKLPIVGKNKTKIPCLRR